MKHTLLVLQAAGAAWTAESVGSQDKDLGSSDSSHRAPFARLYSVAAIAIATWYERSFVLKRILPRASALMIWLPRLLLILFIATLAAAPGGVAAQVPADVPNELIVTRDSDTGDAISIVPQPEPLTATPNGDPLTAPDLILNEYGRVFGITDPASELVESERATDELGNQHTSYTQVYQGVPVVGGDIKVHQNAQGAFTAANGHFYPIPADLSVAPGVSVAAAEQIAIQAVTTVSGTAQVAQSELVILDTAWYRETATGPRLAYSILAGDASVGVYERIFVDAQTGQITDGDGVVDQNDNCPAVAIRTNSTPTATG